MTAFAHTRIDAGHGLAFVIDGNSKITAGNGTYARPEPNALSLPAASVEAREYCPGSTPTCRGSCYVKGLAKHAPNVYAAYTENAATLRHALYSPGAVWTSSAWALGSWIATHAQGGFRWHVSGDVWDIEHARWITAVAFVAHGVRQWIYTRTLEAVPELVRAPNLAVNVSADKDNYDAARAVARHNGARIAYMSTALDDVPSDLQDGDVVFPDYPLRGRDMVEPMEHEWWRGLPHKTRLQVCPADFFSQSEHHRCGPCMKCMEK